MLKKAKKLKDIVRVRLVEQHKECVWRGYLHTSQVPNRSNLCVCFVPHVVMRKIVSHVIPLRFSAMRDNTDRLDLHFRCIQR